MKLFFYSLEHTKREKKIRQILEQILPPDQIDVHRSITSLVEELKKPLKEKPIVVVMIHHREELLDMTSLREQLHQVYLVLILPDADKETVSLSHDLRPNYLTYAHRDTEELKAVLEKMMEKD